MNFGRASFSAFALLLLLAGVIVDAQELSRGVAEYVPVENASSVLEGHIISFTESGYALSSKPYDENIVGVVTKNPSVVVSYVGSSAAVPLVQSGTVQVLVRGPIQTGSYITSSATPGVGVASNDPGFVVGRALASSSVAADQEALVTASIAPGFVWPQGSGLSISSIIANPGETITALPRPLRYVASIGIVLASLLAGYWIYSKTSASTVTALGRNPLASRSIYVLTAFHTTVTVALVTIGVVLGYLILIL